jgi:2-polyprenyl-3-methyl-5-hydroxy-6-metoxy-1,4-benzoquinol methylase
VAEPAREAEAIEAIAAHFVGSRWLQGYVRGKLRSDPAYRAVLVELERRPQPVLDIGCGLGLLSFFLRRNGFTERIRGVDSDAEKIARAAQIAAREYDAGLEFSVGDAREVAADFGAVVMLDVLHYLEEASQERLLEGLASRVPPGGVVVIRTALADGSLRYWVTYLEEIFVRAIRWIRGGGAINFPTQEGVASIFRRAGFEEEIRPLWGRTPFNSYLLVFRRADGAPPPVYSSLSRKLE